MPLLFHKYSYKGYNMTLAFLIYLIQFLNSLKFLVCVLGIVSGFIAFIYLIMTGETNSHETIQISEKANGSGAMVSYHKRSRYFSNFKFFAITAASFITVSICIPSDRTAYMMAGGYVAQTIAQSPASAEIGNKILKIINVKLDTMINDELNKITKVETKDGAGQAVKKQ